MSDSEETDTASESEFEMQPANSWSVNSRFLGYEPGPMGPGSPYDIIDRGVPGETFALAASRLLIPTTIPSPTIPGEAEDVLGRDFSTIDPSDYHAITGPLAPTPATPGVSRDLEATLIDHPVLSGLLDRLTQEVVTLNNVGRPTTIPANLANPPHPGTRAYYNLDTQELTIATPAPPVPTTAEVGTQTDPVIIYSGRMISTGDMVLTSDVWGSPAVTFIPHHAADQSNV